MSYKKLTNVELLEQAQILMNMISSAYDPNELEGVLLEVGM
jgi:hypothetical protein